MGVCGVGFWGDGIVEIVGAGRFPFGNCGTVGLFNVVFAGNRLDGGRLGRRTVRARRVGRVLCVFFCV